MVPSPQPPPSSRPPSRLARSVDFLVAPMRRRPAPPPGVPEPLGDWEFRETVLLRKSSLPSSLLIWTVLTATGLVGVWAFAAPLTQSVAVPGKLEPGGSVRQLDAPLGGLVDAVLVKEGQRVRRGQPLIRFDLRAPRSALASAQAVRQRLLNENQVLRASLGEISAAGLSLNQQRQLGSQQIDLSSKRRAAEEDLNKANERARGLEASLRIATDIVRRYQELARSGAVSEVQLLDALNKQQQLQSDLNAELREIARLEAVERSTSTTPDVELRTRIEANLRQISELDRDIAQARLQIQYGLLTAPADGEVFDINVSSGSVVPPTRQGDQKPVLRLVPTDSLQAKVYLPNNVIGFVRVGQQADISLDTFDASDYGRLRATVKRIGSDALNPEELVRALGADAKGLYFPATLRLQRQTLPAGRKAIPLQPGMTLTADIRLRERRYINILTSFFEDKVRNLERLR
jgi:hemolysin D